MNLLGGERMQNGANLVEGQVAIGIPDFDQYAKAINMLAGVGCIASSGFRTGQDPSLDIASDRARLDLGEIREVLE